VSYAAAPSVRPARLLPWWQRALRRVIQAASLSLLLAALWLVTRLVPESQSRFGTIAAVGFLLLAGTLTSQLVELIGLPHLTGYLLAGIVAGPYALGLIEESSVEDLTLVNTLALALIALEGGAHLRVATLRAGAKSLAYATLFQTVALSVGMGGVFIALHRWIPFARDLPTSDLAGAALLWGAVAVTRSPSATLGILAQTRAKGPLVTSTLTFVMTSDLVVVVLLASVMVVARPLLDPSASFSFADFDSLGHELLGSIALGTTLGLVLAAYLRIVGAQLIIMFVALGFGMTEMLDFLHFEPLLTFMVAGFVVQNLSKQGPKFLEAIERTGSIVYVIFFATAGASLNLHMLRELWPIAVALAACRALVTYGTGRIASRAAGDPPVVKRWAWAGLVAQAGLALGVAASVERAFPSLGKGFAALAIATVALNQMVGPVLFKLALDRSGESRRLGRPSAPSLPDT
jgi:Kef-type K+ transport system membrane component KefB